MIERLTPRTAKIAIFAVAHATYWDQFPGLYEKIMGYHADLVAKVRANGAEVLDFGMVDSSEKAFSAAEKIAAEYSPKIIFATWPPMPPRLCSPPF